jgi:hypothetical protein
MRQRVVLLEDSDVDASDTQESLEEHFPGIIVERISTESDFLHALPDLESDPPKLFILDMLVRWAKTPQTDPLRPPEVLPVPPPPPEVLRDGFYRAGLRCIKALAKYNVSHDRPVIVLTALDRSDLTDVLTENDLEREIVFVKKEFDDGILLREAERLITTPL